MRKALLGLFILASCYRLRGANLLHWGLSQAKPMVASWYGPKFAGRPTASGEIFDPRKLTAAHKTLPLGTKLIVYYPKTGKAVEVRVNDRGPYVPGRHLDLSEAAAEELGLKERGVDTVWVQLIDD